MILKYTNTFPTRLGEIVRIRDLEVGEIGEYTEKSRYYHDGSKGIQWRLDKTGFIHRRGNPECAWRVIHKAGYWERDKNAATAKVEIVEVQ